MKSLSRRSAQREGGLPKWAAALDVIAVVMALVAISVAVAGGFRIWVFEARLSVTDWMRPALWSVIAIAIRHAIVRRDPLPQRVVASLKRWWQSADTRVVLPIHLSSRFGVLLVGFLAVQLVGFPPEAASRSPVDATSTPKSVSVVSSVFVTASIRSGGTSMKKNR